MQVYTKTNWGTLKTLFFFAVVLFIAFLPVSSFLFFLKNDAFTGYFPPKFFMSESLADGYLPLWNPYINFGFPQYGDMSGGYWSPVTWLMASTIGYNAYTFTFEVFFYIFLSGIGMYKLTGCWKLLKEVRLIAAIAFMCCGYHAGHLQHFNWLSGSAFLPWCLWSYLLLVNTPSLKNLLLNVLLFYLLLSSAHPGIVIGALYFFIAVAAYQFFTGFKNSGKSAALKRSILMHAGFIILLLILSAGMIAGYTDIIPHFVRGEKNSFFTGPTDSSSLQSWISLLFPLATVKNGEWFRADLSLRDSYFSLTLLIFFIGFFFNKKTGWQKFLIGAGLFFFLLSIGGVFHAFAGRVLPLLGYVRLNGEFRILAILPFLLIAAIELNKYLTGDKKFEGTIRWIYYILELILFAAIAWSVYRIAITKDSFLYRIPAITGQGGMVNSIKSFLDHTSFYDCLWMQGIIQVFVLWYIKYSLKTRNTSLLLKVVAIDMVIATLLVVPFTGAGKARLQQVQEVLDQSPEGIPLPPLQSISSNDTIPTGQNELIGSWSMFSKEIGYTKEVPYPIQLKNMKAFFKDAYRQNALQYFDKPFLFIKDKADSGRIQLLSFSPSKIVCRITAAQLGDQLILQQNSYPHWSCTVNGRQENIVTDGASFMSVPLRSGTNDVQFLFDPGKVKKGMLISLIAFCVLLSCLVVLALRPRSSSLSSQ